MNRRPLRWSRWMVVGLLAAVLATPTVVSAKPAWVADAARSKGTQRDLDRASTQYNRALIKFDRSKGLVQRQLTRFKSTGNEQQKVWAQANALNAAEAKVAMWKAQARGLKAKAKLATKAGNVDQANAYLDKADQLNKRAERVGAKVAAKKNGMATATATTATTTTEAKTATTETKTATTATAAALAAPALASPTSPAAQASDTERAPGVDGAAAVRGLARGLASGAGKRTAKLQLESGNIVGAMDTLRRMEAQANRGGLVGLVDRYRKWTTKNTVVKEATKQGKTAARQGDVQLASDAVSAISTLRKPGWGTSRQINKIATQAIKGASDFSKHNRPEETRALLSLADQIQKFQGRQSPTLRYRFVRWNAKRRLSSDIELRAKQGNLEAFRSAMRLASAYAKEDGRELKPGELGKIKTLYISALKNSVVRSLDDAHGLLTGKMGYVNPEEAAARYAYAQDTHNRLAERGIQVKTGLFHRSVTTKFSRVRALLTKAQMDSGVSEAKRPGLGKRIIEKLFRQPQNRTQVGVAPVDSKWMARQQRAQQQAEMLRAAAEQGLGEDGGAGAAGAAGISN